MAEPGARLLGDRYALDTLIAGGGMGQVWRGRDTLLGRPVAVKLLRSEYTGDPTFLARFRAEAVHAAALSHPNIAAVYDYGEASDPDGQELAYLVMELVEGESLSTVLRQGGALSPDATLSVLRQTAVALAEAHHVGLVHRDVKPGNILICPDQQVKITDFGIAWSAGSVPLTEAGQVLGTPQYLSPELAVGQEPSPACDVYSLGLVCYECLTGEPAFAGENPVTVALRQVQEDPEPLPAELPAGLQELVDVAVAKDPGDRLADGDAFVAAIDQVRAGRSLHEDPATTSPVPLVGGPAVPGRRPPAVGRRLRALLPVAVALLVGMGVVLGLGLTRGDDPSAAAGPGAGAQAQPAPAIVLDAARYVGRPVEEVVLELAALGLTVDREGKVVDGAVPGDVTGLDALDRALHAGDAVTVVFATGPAPGDAPPAPVAPVEKVAVPAPTAARDEVTVPVSSAAPNPAASTAPPSSSAPVPVPPSAPTSTAPSTAPSSAAPTSAAPTSGPATSPDTSGSASPSDPPSDPPSDSSAPASSSGSESSSADSAPPPTGDATGPADG